MAPENYNLFAKLLRIISLEERNDFVHQSSGGSRQSLTELMLEQNGPKKVESSTKEDAQVIAFPNNADETRYQISEEDVYSVQRIKKNQTHTSLKHLSNVKMEEEEEEIVEKVNIAGFILYEKQKLERINKIVKKRELIKLYQENSVVDIEQEKQFREDLSKSSKVGILLNKKQS